MHILILKSNYMEYVTILQDFRDQEFLPSLHLTLFVGKSQSSYSQSEQTIDMNETLPFWVSDYYCFSITCIVSWKLFIKKWNNLLSFYFVALYIILSVLLFLFSFSSLIFVFMQLALTSVWNFFLNFLPIKCRLQAKRIVKEIL